MEVFMPEPATKKRLVVELDPEEHQAIKAKALLKGVSMREYALEKLRADDDDIKDLTGSIEAALKEVIAHQRGEKTLPTARVFLNALKQSS